MKGRRARSVLSARGRREGRVVLAALPQLEDEHAPLPGVEPRDRVHLLREEECRVASLEGVRRQPVCAQSVEDPSAQT